jgi:hypothetical protein
MWFCPDDRNVVLSLEEFLRGYMSLAGFIKDIHASLKSPSVSVPREIAVGFAEAARRIRIFEKRHLCETYRELSMQINDVFYSHLLIDEGIPWYRIELNKRFAPRYALRIVMGRKKPAPVSLPVAEGRRKAFACEATDELGGLYHVNWNPARIGIGEVSKEIPVYISQHAISRLQERVPMAPFLSALHTMMFDSLAHPTICPAVDQEGFLVELCVAAGKVGYFLVEVHSEFVFVRTFLFLTMQGTPEAKCLRERLGLSRSDIEYFKLDNYLTLTRSDVGEDPDLRRALAECGCDHLLALEGDGDRLSWLKRYREPLRRELGLPFAVPGGEPSAADAPEQPQIQIDELIDCAKNYLKRTQGWTV